IDSWIQTPIRSYLEAGGNVLLLAKSGESFLDDGLLAYLGITLTNIGAIVNDYQPTRPGFPGLTRTGTQTGCVAFDSVRTRPDSELLYKTTTGFSPQRGVGVVRLPAGGAGSAPRGAGSRSCRDVRTAGPTSRSAPPPRRSSGSTSSNP